MNKNIRRDNNKIEDKFFKQSIPGINRLLNKLGIDHKIVKIIPQEFVSYKGETKIMDLGGLIDEDECAINIEFKSNYPSMEEIRNTLEYAFYLSSKYGKKVYSYIISTKNSDKKCYKIENWHNNDDYIIPLHTIKEFNAEETGKRIQCKLDNDEYIDNNDLTDISVLTFMDSVKSPKELLIDSINLINQVNLNNSIGISIDDINGVKNLLILLTKKFAENEEDYDEITGMVKMEGGMLQGTIGELKRIGAKEARPQIIKEAKPGIIKKARPQIIKEATPQIKEERSIEIAQKLIKTEMPTEQISEVTGIKIEEIKEIAKKVHRSETI